MDYHKLMDVAMKVGETMLSHGAEAHRVEDTVYRILKTSNLETIEIFVITTGMIATLADPAIETITVTKRVHGKGNNLKQITYANEISRQYCQGNLTLDEAYEMIFEGCCYEYTDQQAIWGNVLIVTSIPLLVGGTFADCFAAFIASFVVALGLFFTGKVKMHPFMKDLMVAFLSGATFIALEWLFTIPIHQDAVMIACIMPLVPGVAITNAIRDTLNGDYVSGAARAVEAFIKALAIALGIGLSLMVFGGV